MCSMSRSVGSTDPSILLLTRIIPVALSSRACRSMILTSSRDSRLPMVCLIVLIWVCRLLVKMTQYSLCSRPFIIGYMLLSTISGLSSVICFDKSMDV